MQTTREPYEFLCRWTPEGLDSQYAGSWQASINFAFVVRDDDDAVVSWTPDPKGPFHVAIGGGDGIPLADILPGLNAAALLNVQTERAALLRAVAERDAAIALTTQREQDSAAKGERIAALEADIARLSAVRSVAPISRMQAMLVLHDLGLLEHVEAIVAQADERTQLAWRTATDFHRESPTIAALWSALGKTSEELDLLFEAAREIAV